jgi:ABC-type Fe3+-citrate transport system substrate-binding protein
MKKIGLALFLLLISAIGYSQYPIKTIFRGDSVIILTIDQSEKINQVLEKNSKGSKENSKKIKESEKEIADLKKTIEKQNYYIDSLSKLLSEYKDGNNALYDSLWIWSLGPSLIYTQYPDDSTVYVMDLSHYYMTTDDFGIIMVRMSDKEYEKYQSFISRYGLTEEAFWMFRNEIKIKRLNDDAITDRRVWKHKRRSKKKENTEWERF